MNFLALRSIILAHLVTRNRTFALIESDAVWNRDPTSYFLDFSDDADILVPIKGAFIMYARRNEASRLTGYPDRTLTLTFDPMIVFPAEHVQYFFEYMSQRLLDDANLFDQDVLDEMCKVQYQGIACQTFPWDDVADGLWYKISEQACKRK